jgi:hypothetical protein
MGINPNALRFLARECKLGGDFSHTVMIGRQGIHVPAAQIDQILNSEFGLDIGRELIDSAVESGFAEKLLQLLGAGDVESFDYSDYEGATHIHDFNTPIAGRHKNKYTFLIDGGTLEHVFHFTVALKSCMEMLRVGGTYFGITPANNEMGHGFYQFSPELYFRVFSQQNGFRTDNVFLYEGRESRTWLRVADPEIVNRRAERVNCLPTYMLVRATKVAETEIFATPPLQPDYVSAWRSSKARDGNGSPGQHSDRPKSLLRRSGSWLPSKIKRLITMTRVRSLTSIERMKIHFGLNSDSEIYQVFDPKTD